MSADEREQHKDDCVRQALVEGAKSSAWALATSSLLVGLANQYLPAFRTSLGVSGKTALIVSCSPSLECVGCGATSGSMCTGLQMWPREILLGRWTEHRHMNSQACYKGPCLTKLKGEFQNSSCEVKFTIHQPKLNLPSFEGHLRTVAHLVPSRPSLSCSCHRASATPNLLPNPSPWSIKTSCPKIHLCHLADSLRPLPCRYPPLLDSISCSLSSP